MSLQTRLSALITAIGADIKDIKTKTIIPVVTALPATPFDGQEVFYQSAAMATAGQLWKLRYRAGSASAYKWEFVGGADLFNRVATAQNCTSTAFVDLATVGPTFTAPLAGEYLFSWGFSGFNSAASDAYMGLSIGGSAPAAADIAAALSVGTSPGHGSGHEEVGYTLVSAGLVATAKYRVNTASTFSFARRWLRAKPVRVG